MSVCEACHLRPVTGTLTISQDVAKVLQSHGASHGYRLEVCGHCSLYYPHREIIEEAIEKYPTKCEWCENLSIGRVCIFHDYRGDGRLPSQSFKESCAGCFDVKKAELKGDKRRWVKWERKNAK